MNIDTLFLGYREPITYNFRVFLAICRQIYQVERLAPPLELSAWARAYSEIWARATSASWWKSVATTGKWAAVGIVVSLSYPIHESEADHASMFLGSRSIRDLQHWRDHRSTSPDRVQAQGVESIMATSEGLGWTIVSA